MSRLKIVVAYDGTDYFGWQVQEGQKTVAGTLQDTFSYVFGSQIHLTAASRTDAGVHALGQVAVFNTDLSIEPEKLRHAWQNVLPESILIRSIEIVDDTFNPRHQVRQKTYYYHFFQERPLPMVARYGFYYRFPVDIKKLQDCLHVFVGTHDFRSFCTGDDYENTVRTIDSISVEYLQRFKAYRIIIKGPGFLRYMIRRIVGACLEVASRDTLTVADLQKALEQKNPLQLLPTAPAQGLWLYKLYITRKKRMNMKHKILLMSLLLVAKLSGMDGEHQQDACTYFEPATHMIASFNYANDASELIELFLANQKTLVTRENFDIRSMLFHNSIDYTDERTRDSLEILVLRDLEEGTNRMTLRGFAAYTVSKDRKTFKGELLAVKKEDCHTKKYYGTYLVCHGIDRAHAEGATTIWLSTLRTNVQAQALYENVARRRYPHYTLEEKTYLEKLQELGLPISETLKKSAEDPESSVAQAIAFTLKRKSQQPY